LLRAHHDRIYAVCRRVAGNDADAADATQEALLAIVRGLARFDGRAAFTTWSYRVATNACLDELRRRRRRPAPTDLQEHTATAPDPGLAVDATVTDRMVLDDALAQLPEEFRVPVVLRDVGGLDYAEIAETLAIPPGTVRSRISRGRRALARVLAGNQLASPDRPTDAP
jgi:RNA polymerase sigma-70 factor, ECF subfamily